MAKGPWTREELRRVENTWEESLKVYTDGRVDRLGGPEGPAFVLKLMPTGTREEDLNVDLPKFLKNIDGRVWPPDEESGGAQYWIFQGCLVVSYDTEDGRRRHVLFYHDGSVEVSIPIRPTRGTVDKKFWGQVRAAVSYYSECLSTHLQASDFYLAFALMGLNDLEIDQHGKSELLQYDAYRFYPAYIRGGHIKEDLEPVRMMTENTLGASEYLKK